MKRKIYVETSVKSYRLQVAKGQPFAAGLPATTAQHCGAGDAAR